MAETELATRACTDNLISRRTLIAGGAGLVAAATAAALPALAREASAAPEPASSPNAALVRTALDCAGTGELCLKHCYAEFAKGDTMLAQCAARVAEMIPVCQALASLAALESTHLKAFARVCIDVCKACEDECRKHTAHAEICKQCADACARVVSALQVLA